MSTYATHPWSATVDYSQSDDILIVDGQDIFVPKEEDNGRFIEVACKHIDTGTYVTRTRESQVSIVYKGNDDDYQRQTTDSN